MYKKILLATSMVLPMVFASAHAAEVNLKGANFNSEIKTVSADPKYKPVTVFSSNGKTFIQFPSNINENNLPLILVDRIPNNPIPKIAFNNGYVVINQPASTIKIYEPQSEKLLYTVSFANQFNYGDITPSPRVLAREYSGLNMQANLGLSAVDGESMTNFFFAFALGYDFDLSRNWLLGPQIAYQNNGKYDDNGKTSKSWNINLAMRLQYLFDSGISLVGKAGVAFVNNSSDLKPNVSNGPAPLLGASVGYVFKNNIRVSLDYDQLIDLNTVMPVSTVSVGLSYNF